MLLIWLLHIAIITFACWYMFRTQKPSPVNKYFWWALSAKLVSGVLLGLLYHIYLAGGDTWAFYEAANQLASLVPGETRLYLHSLVTGEVPEELRALIEYAHQPRSWLMIRLVSIPLLITGGNYWLSSLYFSLFSFFGLWHLTLQVVKNYRGATFAALVAFLFLPTVCFWSSGVIKEAVFMGGFGILLTWYWPWPTHRTDLRWYHWLISLFLVAMLVSLKYYYMAVFLPVLITTILHQRMGWQRLKWPTGHLAWFLLFSGLLLLASLMHPNLELHQVVGVIKANGQQVVQKSSDSAIFNLFAHPDPLIWLMINFPLALVTGLFRPTVGEWGSILQNLVILENMVIVIFTLLKLKSPKRVRWDAIEWLPCLVYILILCGMLTLATPNFGTLVRFKTAYMPIFVFLILYKNIWWDRFTKHLPYS